MTQTRPDPSLEEFARGRWDVTRWAWVYLGIRLHPGQRRMVDAYIKRTKSGWRALYLWMMIAAGNRAGKTMCLALIILHSCTYKMGLEPPKTMDPEAIRRWGRLPYDFWHFAIEQGPAEQVFSEISQMLQGIHPAQKFGCPWAQQVGGYEKIASISDLNGSKERGEYALIKLNAELGGATIHFRSTKAKSLGSVGQNMHGVSFDEAGLETNLEYLVKEVLHARRLGTGGQFILISTPSVATSTEFEDLWFTGDPDDPFRLPRRFSMRMSSRENIGYGLDRQSFDDLIEGMPQDWIDQNIEGLFIQAKNVWFHSPSVDACFDPSLPEDEAPRAGMLYVQALDPGLKDKCWSLTFRINADGTATGVHIERMSGKQTTRGIVQLGARVHQMYEMSVKGIPLSRVDTGVDTTALGGHMFRDLIEEHIPVKSIEFGGVSKAKRLLLSDAKSFIDEGRLRMPATGEWEQVRKQLRIYKLLDRKIEQDLVMAITIVVKLIRQSPRMFSEGPTNLDYTNPSTGEERRSDGINARTLRSKLAAQARARAIADQAAVE